MFTPCILAITSGKQFGGALGKPQKKVSPLVVRLLKGGGGRDWTTKDKYLFALKKKMLALSPRGEGVRALVVGPLK